ncbi:MAG: hypothetical protein V1493_00145 [Candidatus Diapherotrites archaeon]
MNKVLLGGLLAGIGMGLLILNAVRYLGNYEWLPQVSAGIGLMLVVFGWAALSKAKKENKASANPASKALFFL